MSVNLSALQAQIDALTAQVTTTEGVEASAKAAIVGLLSGQADAIAAAVTAALQADDAADQGSIDAAVAAIPPVTQRFMDSAANLAAAVPASSPAA